MKPNILTVILLLCLCFSCSKSVDYSSEFKKEVTGRDLFNANEEIEANFQDNKLFLKWRGAEQIEPLYLGEDIYFVKEMNKKIKFSKQNGDANYSIVEVPTDDTLKSKQASYKKLPDSVQVPSNYLKNGEYDKAREGYIVIQKQDSNSVFVEEKTFNRMGYKKMNEKKYNEAIGIFKINVALYPESDNVYDSLADAYLRSGDSINAFINFKKALEYNTGNKRAKRFVAAYNKE